MYSRLAATVNVAPALRAVVCLLGWSLLCADAAPATRAPDATACDPALAQLFTPRHPRVGRYEVCATSRPIDETAPAGWTIEALEPVEAFGAGGAYDRAALQQLYGGRRARVARGWVERGRVVESQTFVSPYPSRDLTRLDAGTLVIRYVVPR